MLLSINSRIIDKPAKRSGLHKNFVSCELTAPELAEHVKQGHAFSAQFVGGHRKFEHFLASGFLAVDIDEGLSLSDALAKPFVQDFGAFVYTTPNHTADHNRFRIVFEMHAPITDGRVYEAALRGLVSQFKSDATCKDAARLFFGSSRGELVHIGRTLPNEQVSVLVASGTLTREPVASRTLSGHLTRRRVASFGPDHVVALSSGKHAPLSSLSAKTSIHCPSHVDKRPSAMVVHSCTGGVGVFCHSCEVTDWVSSAPPTLDFNWHLPYLAQADQHEPSGTGKKTASKYSFTSMDGTNVWIYDDRFLPELPLVPGLTYIRSPKGSGKTEQLCLMVKKLKAQHKSILLVGHRRSLLRSLARRLDLPFYLADKSRDELNETGCFAVSLDSVPIILNPEDGHTFDAIFIDESEQVVSHFTSKTMADRRSAVRACLEHYLHHASHIVCADADIGLLTAGFFELTFGRKHPDTLLLNRHRLGTDAIATTGPSPISVVEIYPDKQSLLRTLDNDLRLNKRCFVATNSKAMAETIDATIEKRYPAKKRLLVTSETSERQEVRAYTNKPAEKTYDYDVVICSPALSTGVDISFDSGVRGVDSVYGIFKDGITTHHEIDQQISRVRDPGAVRVWVSAKVVPYEIEPSVILQEMIRERNYSLEQVIGYTEGGRPMFGDDKMLELLSMILSVRRASLTNLKALFVELKEQNGWTVQEVNHCATDSLAWTIRSGPDTQRVEKIVNAEDLNATDYAWMPRGRMGKGLTEAQLASKKKFEIKTRYRVKEVTRDLVELDDGGKFTEKFLALETLFRSDMELQQILRKSVFDDGKASYDWPHTRRKKRLLIKLLSAAGVFDPTSGFVFDHTFTTANLRAFIRKVIASSKDLDVLCGLRVRTGDLHKKPVSQLNAILDHVGMKSMKVWKKGRGPNLTIGYRVDEAWWNHVTTTCQMDSEFLRQITEASALASSFVLAATPGKQPTVPTLPPLPTGSASWKSAAA